MNLEDFVQDLYLPGTVIGLIIVAGFHFAREVCKDARRIQHETSRKMYLTAYYLGIKAGLIGVVTLFHYLGAEAYLMTMFGILYGGLLGVIGIGMAWYEYLYHERGQG